jgi:hypothetical protein
LSSNRKTSIQIIDQIQENAGIERRRAALEWFAATSYARVYKPG